MPQFPNSKKETIKKNPKPLKQYLDHQAIEATEVLGGVEMHIF